MISEEQIKYFDKHFFSQKNNVQTKRSDNNSINSFNSLFIITSRLCDFQQRIERI